MCGQIGDCWHISKHCHTRSNNSPADHAHIALLVGICRQLLGAGWMDITMSVEWCHSVSLAVMLSMTSVIGEEEVVGV